ncbi:hypothetical protein ABG067_006551 [Albugo candida]
MNFETVKIEDEEDMYMLTFYMDGSEDRRGAYKRCMSILSPSSISKGKPSGKAKGKSSNSKRIPSGKAKRNTETQLLYEPFSTDQTNSDPNHATQGCWKLSRTELSELHKEKMIIRPPLDDSNILNADRFISLAPKAVYTFSATVTDDMISYIMDINRKTEDGTSIPKISTGLADIYYAGFFYKSQNIEIRFSPYLLQLPQEAYDATINEIKRNGYDIDYGIHYRLSTCKTFDMVMQLKLLPDGKTFIKLPGTHFKVSNFERIHIKPSGNGAWILTPVLMAGFPISVDTRGDVKQYEIVAKA